MQVPVRSSTSARPPAASPGMPVSDCGIASPTTTYGRNRCSSAVDGRTSTDITSMAAAVDIADLAKCIHRDALVPGLRADRFSRTYFARRLERACGDTLALREHAIAGLIDARLREGVIGRDHAITGADKSRCRLWFARDQARDCFGACLCLRIRRRCGFRDYAPKAGVADRVNSGQDF